MSRTEKNPVNRGNATKINPKKKIIPDYATNVLTQYTENVNGTVVPRLDISHVMDARDFVDENQL